jgi:hypothetical protein
VKTLAECSCSKANRVPGVFAAAGIVQDLHTEEAESALAIYQDECKALELSSANGIDEEESTLPVTR